MPPCAVLKAAAATLAREEEASFSRTLLKGIERFKKAAAAAEGNTLSGRDAFELWDTFGFPQDLTQVLAALSNLVPIPANCRACMKHECS